MKPLFVVTGNEWKWSDQVPPCKIILINTEITHTNIHKQRKKKIAMAIAIVFRVHRGSRYDDILGLSKCSLLDGTDYTRGKRLARLQAEVDLIWEKAVADPGGRPSLTPHFWGPRLYSEAQITHFSGGSELDPLAKSWIRSWKGA